MSDEKIISQGEVKRKYDKMMERAEPVAADKFNCYTCEECGHVTKTVDIDDGTTPFFLECERCNEQAFSSFYEDIKPEQKPTWEFYRPSLDAIYKLRKHPATLEHVLSGGLILRKIANGEGLRVV